MTKMTKTAAQLDRDIAAYLAEPEPLGRPISRGPIGRGESLVEFSARVQREARARQKTLHQAMLRHQALFVTDRRGRTTLLILSGEMSHPDEGRYRVTKLLRDGPEGHVTRPTITRLAQDLARDLSPDYIRPASEEDVAAWVSTPEYLDGSERVLEMQRRNRR